jgi:hypothetical protein
MFSEPTYDKTHRNEIIFASISRGYSGRDLPAGRDLGLINRGRELTPAILRIIETWITLLLTPSSQMDQVGDIIQVPVWNPDKQVVGYGFGQSELRT